MIKPKIKQLEDRHLLFILAQQNGTEGGSQRQGDKARKNNRDTDGDRKLTIKFARDAAEEGDRRKYRRQYEYDCDQRAADFFHGFLRRFIRIKIIV